MRSNNFILQQAIGLTNTIYKLMKSIAASFIIFISVDFIIINSASANSIPAVFGAGTKIYPPNANIAVENLNISDRT